MTTEIISKNVSGGARHQIAFELGAEDTMELLLKPDYTRSNSRLSVVTALIAGASGSMWLSAADDGINIASVGLAAQVGDPSVITLEQPHKQTEPFIGIIRGVTGTPRGDLGEDPSDPPNRLLGDNLNAKHLCVPVPGNALEIEIPISVVQSGTPNTGGLAIRPVNLIGILDGISGVPFFDSAGIAGQIIPSMYLPASKGLLITSDEDSTVFLGMITVEELF